MSKYDVLKKPVSFPNGGTIPNSIAMAPMVVCASNSDGSISQLDIDYFERRSRVAGLIITGAASINKAGWAEESQIGAFDDNFIDGLSKVAAAAQKDGNKAILQLQHAGRGAQHALELSGETVAPSAIDFPFLSHVPKELTEEEILQTIKDFGSAARRAIKAGFSGVEIHGANHYLLQQFFSVYSNRRTDKWGGSLENRSRFPLAVVEEIKRVVKEENAHGFIVGYRITPEEIHGDNVGYRIDDALHLIDRIADAGVDYIHISLFTRYDAKPQNSEKSYGVLVKEKVNGRLPVVNVASVFTVDDAVEALQHADIVAIAREALIEPEFAGKIEDNRIDEIRHALNNNIDELVIPKKTIALFLMEGTPLQPLPGIETLDEETLKLTRKAYSFDSSSVK